MSIPFFGKKTPPPVAASDEPLEEWDGDEVGRSDGGAASLENVKQDLKSKGGRNFSFMLKFLLGFFALVAVFYAFTGKKAAPPVAASVAPKPATQYDASTGAAVVANEGFKEDIKTYNQENALVAAEQRKSSQAVVLATNMEPSVAGHNSGRTREQQQAEMQALAAKQAAFDKARMDDFGNLSRALSMATTADNVTFPVEGPATVAKRAAEKAELAATTTASRASAGVGGTSPAAASGPVLIEAFRDAYATLDYTAATDGSPLVISTIRGGVLNGAKLQGSLSITDSDQGVVAFNMLKLPGMPDIPVKAQGVNLESREMIVSGTLDRKLWIRFGMPFVASMVGAYGQLTAQQGATTVAIQGVGSVTTSPVLTSTQLAQAAAGQAMSQAAGMIRGIGQAAKPAFKIAAGQEVGVIFLADVIAPAGVVNRAN